MQFIINQPISIPFTRIGFATGTTTFTPRILLNGLLIVVTPITYIEIGGGLYTINFTPVAIGNISIFIEQGLITNIEIVQKTNTQLLRNLEDAAVGSWKWDEVAGTMAMIRLDGTLLSNFNIVDTLNIASRERF
jgi:hypothetical protein